MAEINLLNSLPKSKRNIGERSDEKTSHHIDISRQYSKDYFDGSRDYGYGGYRYDGRWKSVAKDIIKQYSLKKNDKLLDIGCAKGYLVNDFHNDPRVGEACGVDISAYALIVGVREGMHIAITCHPELKHETLLHEICFKR